MADTYIIGPGTGKSQVQQYHDFLLSEAGNLPYSSQWVLQIDKLPASLDNNLSSISNNNTLELGNWNTAEKSGALKKIITEGAFIDKGVCIFAQGVQTPKDSLSVQNVGPNENFRGGLLGAPTSTGRQPLPELNIVFLETNYSFLDFVIRPWVIYTSHYGLIARAPTDPRNIKTTLQIFYYDRGFGETPKIRKVFRFYNVAPIATDGVISTWDDQDIKKISTSWTYTHYDVSTERISKVSPLICNTIGNIKIPGSETLQNFIPNSSISTINTNYTIPPSIGSETLSNPTGYTTPDSPPTNGGLLLGGSYSG